MSLVSSVERVKTLSDINTASIAQLLEDATCIKQNRQDTRACQDTESLTSATLC